MLSFKQWALKLLILIGLPLSQDINVSFTTDIQGNRIDV